jgi:hypothetical protein
MSIIGLSMAALPCCAEEDEEAGSAALRVDRPVYPRRAEHNTSSREGIEDALTEADEDPREKASAEIDVAAGGCWKNAAPLPPLARLTGDSQMTQDRFWRPVLDGPQARQRVSQVRRSGLRNRLVVSPSALP